MIPEVEFYCSGIYNQIYRELPPVKKVLKKKNKEYPSMKEIISYKNKIEKTWKKDSRRIFREIEKISGLKWKKKEIVCYLVGVGRCISAPLTMRIYNDKDLFVDVLTHELIHNIQSQNLDKWEKWHKNIIKKYKKESKNCRSHIFLDAVLYKVIENLHGKKRLNKTIEKDSKSKLEGYKRAMEIVLKETPDKIIKEFRRVTK